MKAIINIAGQKKVAMNIKPERVIREDLAENAVRPEFQNAFGKLEDEKSLTSILVNNTIDTSLSTFKLTCKDGAKLALDFNLPWNQAEAELSKVSGTPEFTLYLAGVVG